MFDISIVDKYCTVQGAQIVENVLNVLIKMRLDKSRLLSDIIQNRQNSKQAESTPDEDGVVCFRCAKSDRFKALAGVLPENAIDEQYKKNAIVYKLAPTDCYKSVGAGFVTRITFGGLSEKRRSDELVIGKSR